MFSTAQQTVIDNLVPSYLSQGYQSYLVYTHTQIGNYYQVAEPDLIFIFSKDKIECRNAYQYIASEDSIKVEYRTGNYSTSQYANNTERVNVSDFSGNINVNIYEHIFTNAQSEALSIQPDIMKGGYQNEGLQAQTGNVLLSAFFLVFVFLQMWKIHR